MKVALSVFAVLFAIAVGPAAAAPQQPPASAMFSAEACREFPGSAVIAKASWSGATLRLTQFWAHSAEGAYLGEVINWAGIKDRNGTLFASNSAWATAASIQVNFYDAKDKWTHVLVVEVGTCTFSS